MTEQANLEQCATATLIVPDLTEALDFFTHRLGFRLEMIVPADAPQAALVSGQNLKLRLESREIQPEPIESTQDSFVISRYHEATAWKLGRAGMQYRDLIPGRLGGRVIASHIRIPDGGETPDYVHYHKVGFQMIYCKAGWVRVVYEDQGPPFVLEPGDCVLQPPEIRHRVLESSPGLEVIEIGCPAIHETWVDHELKLPTQQILPERLFGGQHFVRHIAREAQWRPWRLDVVEERDFGFAEATNGLATARIVCANGTFTAATNRHAGGFLFLFVLQGELVISRAEVNHLLQTGDSCIISGRSADESYAMQASAGLETLEVSYSEKNRQD